MNNICAVLVGIDRYDHPDWNVEGPCANAIAVARWLLTLPKPTPRIHLFLDALRSLDEDIAELRAAGATLNFRADWSSLDKFMRTKLQDGCPAESRLLVFWSGHGCTGATNDRIFFCSDYTEKLPNRTFNGSNFLRLLRTRDYHCFDNQIVLADVCGVYYNLQVDDHREQHQQTETHQLAIFATPEGQYTTGAEGRGVFTDTAIAVLKDLGTPWANHEAFFKALESALTKVGKTAFRIYSLSDQGEIVESRIGAVAERRDDLDNQVLKILSDHRNVVAENVRFRADWPNGSIMDDWPFLSLDEIRKQLRARRVGIKDLAATVDRLCADDEVYRSSADAFYVTPSRADLDAILRALQAADFVLIECEDHDRWPNVHALIRYVCDEWRYPLPVTREYILPPVRDRLERDFVKFFVPRSRPPLEIEDPFNSNNEFLYGRRDKLPVLEKLLELLSTARNAGTREQREDAWARIKSLPCRTLPPNLLNDEGVRVMSLNRPQAHGYLMVEALREIVTQLRSR